MTLEEFKKISQAEIEQATSEITSVSDEQTLNNFKGRFLGKKSHLTDFYASMRDVVKEEKKDFGIALNDLFTKLFLRGLC